MLHGDRRAIRYNAHRFGKNIGCDIDTRKRLKLTMIVAVGLTPAMQQRARAQAHKRYMKDIRCAEAEKQGEAYTPRELSKAAQAREQGINRTTLWRRERDRLQRFGCSPAQRFRA